MDVPRLIEGHVAIEAFTVVTKTPRGLNVRRNDDRSDMITPLAMAQRWPPRTWTSLRERALYLAQTARETAERSEGRLTLLRTRDDLTRYLERRKTEPAITAAFLGLEGAHALEGDLAAVDTLFDAGFRMIAPTHFFDTEWAGSAHGVAKGGLTEKGRALVRRLEERRILLDLAHASPRTIADALAMATRPVVVSHSGVKGTCDNARNLSDAELRGVAADRRSDRHRLLGHRRLRQRRGRHRTRHPPRARRWPGSITSAWAPIGTARWPCPSMPPVWWTSPTRCWRRASPKGISRR